MIRPCVSVLSYGIPGGKSMEHTDGVVLNIDSVKVDSTLVWPLAARGKYWIGQRVSSSHTKRWQH